MTHIPYQFWMKLCYLLRIFQNIGYQSLRFSNNLVLSAGQIWNIPPFALTNWGIFHTFENMKFPTFYWPFDPFPNPSWLCQPIPYVFKALKIWNMIPDIFNIFPTRGNPECSCNLSVSNFQQIYYIVYMVHLVSCILVILHKEHMFLGEHVIDSYMYVY